MARPSGENLSQFVSRIMFEKSLNFQQVSEMSGDKITEGYVRSITNGTASNPSVKKLKALALGLGVSEDEVFNVARGLAAAGEGGPKDNSSASYHVILKLMSECWKNPVLGDLLHEVAKLSLASQEQALKMLRLLNRRQEAIERSRRAR
jgi:transcriptional regulator with XRE-family HTH domain